MLVGSLIGNSNTSSAALFFFSEQRLSPESKRLHVLKQMPNDANRNHHNRQNQESKATDVSNKVQHRRKVTFQDPEDNSANVVVEHCLSAVFEEYKGTIFPKGTYINYSCCIC